MSASKQLTNMNELALSLLHEDANKITNLIEIQMENLSTRKCPLYEEVLDTQMYGLSREVDFAIRAGLISEEDGKALLKKVEQNLAHLYECMNEKAQNQ